MKDQFFGVPLDDWHHKFATYQPSLTAGDFLAKAYRVPIDLQLTTEQQDHAGEVCRAWNQLVDTPSITSHLLKAMAQAALAVWDDCFEDWVTRNLNGAYDDIVGVLHCHPIWVNKLDSHTLDMTMTDSDEDFAPHVHVWVDFTTLKECRASIRGWMFGYEGKTDKHRQSDGDYLIHDEDVFDMIPLRNWEIDYLKTKAPDRRFRSRSFKKARRTNNTFPT